MLQPTYLLALLLVCCALEGAAQNQVTPEGLFVGPWTEEYGVAERERRVTGCYKIIPLSTYDTIQEHWGTAYEIRFRGATPLLFFSGRHKDTISVKDGIWQTFDASGNLLSTEYWQQGLSLWTRHFDEASRLIQYDYVDLDNDSLFFLTYKDGQLYKKAFYSPDDKNHQTEVFYPEQHLVIPDAEPSLYFNFGDTVANVFTLKLSCKKDLTINAISSSSRNAQTTFLTNAFPLKLTTTDTAIINFAFTPTPASFRPRDTITIVTSEENAPPYKIYCTLKASHIDFGNVESLQAITLSKSKDRFLVIAPMGTQTDAYITHSDGHEDRYRILEITKIDLRGLDVGEYQLAIYSCNSAGSMTLTVLE